MLMLAAIGCCFLAGSASAMTHIVGGAFGWRAPENNKTSFYADWAFPRTFGVGDQLVFPYRPGSGNVVVVNKEDFDACTQKNVIYMYFNGPTTVSLTKPGDYYYYSGVGKHCEFGQKLHINVVEGKQGSSGKPLPFKINMATKTKPSAGAPAPEPSSPAPSNDAAAPKSSAASATIQNVGMASGLLTILFSLFI